MEGNTSYNLCVTPRRKRSWIPASVTNAYTKRRRRASLASVDLGRELEEFTTQPISRRESIGDRFIAARAESMLPLNTTPRTRRIAKVFGLTEDKVLKYSDTCGSEQSSMSDSPEYDHLRSNFSQLLYRAAQVTPTSASANLGGRKQFILALDGPGVPTDPFAYPLTWSKNNVIAVACGKDVYHQDLDNRAIVHMCEIDRGLYGRPRSVQWSPMEATTLAVGTTVGAVQLWDAPTKKRLHDWTVPSEDCIGGMDWNRSLLTVGTECGQVNFYDQRMQAVAHRVNRHKSKVHGVKWNVDGNYLASSDQQGIVYLWDARGGKVLTDESKMGGKMKHNAPVKALAWCPWQPDLLATGSTYPDGKLRVFSVKSASPVPQPQHILSLDASITSIHWSPHCKEILTTHGTAWDSKIASSSSTGTNPPRPVRSPIANSITVHTYPSYKRIVSVTAHVGAVGHSCLSPDGTMVFTICPSEEAMKMWKVWSLPQKPPKQESMYDKFNIR